MKHVGKSPEEVELQQKTELLHKRQDELAELELTLSTVEDQLKSFEMEYFLKIGSRYVEIDRLQAILDKLIASRSPFEATALLKAEESRARAEKSAHDAESVSHGENNIQRAEPTPKLRELYREAAKICHPDLTLDAKEKDRRHLLMQEINEAYRRRDIEKLRQIYDSEKNNPELIKGEDTGSALVRVIRQIAQIDNRISELKSAVGALESTDLYHLFETVTKEMEVGKDILEALSNELQSRIVSLERQTAALIEGN